ncbi:MAG TPA: carboxypeptidase-like regulatory domain-containing protein [Gemmatimonadaceae bacterium]|jgi:hypothetical protein|nr:carboxypeptidase-like regulatory domain-containing protein [Gemmatimonadaceae bacterium]
MKRSIPFALAILAIVAACDANNSTGPFTGTLKGSISSSLGGALANIRIVVDPPSGDSTVLHTASDGSFQLDNVPLGTGTVQVESLPADCDSQPPINFFLESPQTTASVILTVKCTSSHQVVTGLGDLDGGAVNEVRRNRPSRGHDARRVGLEYRVARPTDTPQGMGHVIFDRRSVALTRVSPVTLGDERRL